jgi:hypothetical protein
MGRRPPAVDAVGMRFIPLKPGADLDLRQLDTRFPERMLTPGSRGCNAATMICRIFYFKIMSPAAPVSQQSNQEAGHGA